MQLEESLDVTRRCRHCMSYRVAGLEVLESMRQDISWLRLIMAGAGRNGKFCVMLQNAQRRLTVVND